MALLSVNRLEVGKVGVTPGIVLVNSTDLLSTVVSAGYLNAQNLSGTVINSGDFIAVDYNGGQDWFKPSISSAGIITLVSIAPIIVTPTVANALAVFSDTNGTLTDNIAASNTVANSSATPGTVRSVVGAMTSSATTMTSGNLVGVRGSVTYVGASGGFLYGVQGKLISSGTLSGSSWNAAIFGQFDISTATVNAGQTACIWGDYGTSSGTITSATGMRGIAMTNTTAAVLNAQDYRYGNATYLLELAGAGGTLNYYAAAGTSAGSAGDAAHCAAQMVLKIEVNGVAAYIPVFTQNT